MPSERFEKLANTKKEKIIDAAIDEFTVSGYEGASINMIIKNANISRGSFYTYFNDKEDIFRYVMHFFMGNAVEFIVNTLKEAKGDIIEMSIKLYDTYEDCKAKNTNEKFGLVDSVMESFFTFKKTDINKNLRNENVFQKEFGKILCEKLWDNCSEELKGYGKEAFLSLLELIFTILFKAASKREFLNEDRVQVRKQLMEWMGFIRRGI